MKSLNSAPARISIVDMNPQVRAFTIVISQPPLQLSLYQNAKIQPASTSASRREPHDISPITVQCVIISTFEIMCFPSWKFRPHNSLLPHPSPFPFPCKLSLRPNPAPHALNPRNIPSKKFPENLTHCSYAFSKPFLPP
jgi:hypothetical protein